MHVIYYLLVGIAGFSGAFLYIVQKIEYYIYVSKWVVGRKMVMRMSSGLKLLFRHNVSICVPEKQPHDPQTTLQGKVGIW